MPESDYKLLALFFILSACIILRVSVESTGYCSPDSIYYLEVAESLLKGNGFYHSNVYPIPKIKTPETQTFLAVWPLGYPLLIAFTSFVSSLPVFWASKVVNIIFLGLCLLLFRKINRDKAYFLGITFSAFTFIEVFSYTWSEGPFLFGFLYLGYILTHFWSGYIRPATFVSLFFCCLFLFLIRYIGGFIFLFIGGLSCWFYFKNNKRVAFKLFLVFISLCLFAALYLYVNFLHTGYFTGGERLFPYRESGNVFVWYLFKGLFNEFFIIKNYYFRHEPIALFLITAVFQILIFLLIYFNLSPNRMGEIAKGNKFIKVYFFLGLYYLTILVILRRLSPFDAFDYRLLSPFTVCMYVAIWLYLIHTYPKKLFSKISKYLLFLFGISLLMNLPKVYLIENFKKMIQSLV